MAKRRGGGNKGSGGGELALGLFAFFSAGLNVAQVVKQNRLQGQTTRIEAALRNLRARYEDVTERYEVVSDWYAILWRANERLRTENSQLHAELESLARLNKNLDRKNAELMEKRGAARARVLELQAALEEAGKEAAAKTDGGETARQKS